MQGQRSTIGSFPENINADPEPISNNAGMSEQSRFSSFVRSPSEAGIGNDVQTWDAGEPSSRSSPQSHINEDGMKAEQGWASLFDPHAGAGPSEEGLSEPSNSLFHGRVNTGSSSSSSDQAIRRPNLHKSVESETNQDEEEEEENNGGAGARQSLTNWGMSYKRKALEGTSRQSYVGESSRDVLGPHYNTSNSLSLSPPSWSSSVAPEHLNPRFGNVGLRLNQEPQHDSIPFSLSSMGSSRRFNIDSSGSTTSMGVSGNSIAPQGQSRLFGLPRNVHPFPRNGSSESRTGTSYNLGATLQDEPNLRSIPRNNVERPLFVTPSETRSLGQDPTNWSLATTGHISSSSRVAPSSSAHPLTNPQNNPQAQNWQSLSEFSPWSLFPLADSESGGHNGHLPQMSSGPSASSRETMLARLRQARNQPYPRSAFLLERQGDDALGPHSLRALAADIEGRHRLISEIRQVLGAMRRGENLRAEDFMLFDPFIYHGMADLHDRHRDMRLDVDNMSYEELLALGEQIGDVSTGLSEEAISKTMKQREFMSITTETTIDLEPCCICQEQYVDGDELGTLDCGHDFHTDCIKQWLMQKNLCPICKTKALQA